MASTLNMCTLAIRRFSLIKPNYLVNPSFRNLQCRHLVSSAENTSSNATPPQSEQTSGSDGNERTEQTKNQASEQATTNEQPAGKQEGINNEQIEKIKKEAEASKKEAADFKDRYMRSLAEAENIRVRMRKQVDDAKLFGIQGFCKELLEVADVLEKATESVPQEELNDDNPHLKNLYDGLKMTEKELLNVFNRNGLNKIAPADGEKFDPNFHDAQFQVPLQEGMEPGTIAVVNKIGYTLHSRTIRPALVGVFKK